MSSLNNQSFLQHKMRLYEITIPSCLYLVCRTTCAPKYVLARSDLFIQARDFIVVLSCSSPNSAIFSEPLDIASTFSDPERVEHGTQHLYPFSEDKRG